MPSKPVPREPLKVNHPILGRIKEVEDLGDQPEWLELVDEKNMVALQWALLKGPVKNLHQYLTADILGAQLLRQALNDNVAVNFQQGAIAKLIEMFGLNKGNFEEAADLDTIGLLPDEADKEILKDRDADQGEGEDESEGGVPAQDARAQG